MFNSYVVLCVGCGFSSVQSARVEESALPLTSIATSLLLSVIASEVPLNLPWQRAIVTVGTNKRTLSIKLEASETV